MPGRNDKLKFGELVDDLSRLKIWGRTFSRRNTMQRMRGNKKGNLWKWKKYIIWSIELSMSCGWEWCAGVFISHLKEFGVTGVRNHCSLNVKKWCSYICGVFCPVSPHPFFFPTFYWHLWNRSNKTSFDIFFCNLISLCLKPVLANVVTVPLILGPKSFIIFTLFTFSVKVWVIY